MKIIMKIFITILTIQTILIYADSDLKANSQAKPTILPIKKTLFVNGRFNEIELIITNQNNKQHVKYITPGNIYEYHDGAKKVVCCEKFTTNITLTPADLQTYTAFVFNADKLEKYHFINIRGKDRALQYVRDNDPKNETLLNELSSQSIYNP